jgi:type IX secretion system PorP/SprF family membrane protein
MSYPKMLPKQQSPDLFRKHRKLHPMFSGMLRSIVSGLLLMAMNLIFVNPAMSQDPQYSQFYAAPLYLNPAFAGSSQQGRLGLNYRNQWPSIDANFTTFSAFADFYLEDYNSGFGAIMTRDLANALGLQNTTFGLQYAYQLQLTKKISFRPGVQVAVNSRSLNYSKLIFGDQIDPVTGSIRPGTGENLSTGPTVIYPDLSFGGLFYSARGWLGVAGSHLTRPNQSLTGSEDRLPTKFSAHAGWKFYLTPGTMGEGYSLKSQERSITPAFQYRHQGKFDQMDVGLYFTMEPLVIGMWYRGVPFKKINGIINNESLVFSIGLIKKSGKNLNDILNIGYSYDYTISKLGPVSGGAHEVSLVYSWPIRNPRKPAKDKLIIPCPTF